MDLLKMKQLMLLALNYSLLGACLVVPELSATNYTSENQLTSERKTQLIHLLKQDCGSCHGMTLQGGLGPSLTKEALNGKPFFLIKNTIIYGRPGTAMPPWDAILSDKDITWISHQLLKGITDEK